MSGSQFQSGRIKSRQGMLVGSRRWTPQQYLSRRFGLSCVFVLPSQRRCAKSNERAGHLLLTDSCHRSSSDCEPAFVASRKGVAKVEDYGRSLTQNIAFLPLSGGQGGFFFQGAANEPELHWLRVLHAPSAPETLVLPALGSCAGWHRLLTRKPPSDFRSCLCMDRIRSTAFHSGPFVHCSPAYEILLHLATESLASTRMRSCQSLHQPKNYTYPLLSPTCPFQSKRHPQADPVDYLFQYILQVRSMAS
jgi:hypothetical protein